MKYVFNDYLLATQDEEKNLIIYNTLDYFTIKIPNSDIEKFNDFRTQIINNGCYNGSSKNLDLFLSQNIVRRADDSMTAQLHERYKSAMLSNRILTVIILPTEKCNFRCVYCYEDYTYGEMSCDVIDKVCELLERLVPYYDILNLSWFGGEPLLAMDVIRRISSDAARICKKYKKAYYSQMTTNGYLLNLDIIKELLKLHFVLFQITVDGDRSTHNKQRSLADGSGTYDTIIKNLLLIKEAVSTKTIKIILRINVSNNMNSNEIKSLAKMFEDDNRFVINIQRIFDVGGNGEKSGTDYESYLQVFQDCQNYITDSLEADDTMCYAGKQSTIMIRPNGNIGKCTVNLNDEKNYFGNILSLDLSKFSLESCEYCNCIIDNETCLKCPIYPLCFGKQCPARRKQACKNTIDKYTIMIKSFSKKAKILRIV